MECSPIGRLKLRSPASDATDLAFPVFRPLLLTRLSLPLSQHLTSKRTDFQTKRRSSMSSKLKSTDSDRALSPSKKPSLISRVSCGKDASNSMSSTLPIISSPISSKLKLTSRLLTKRKLEDRMEPWPTAQCLDHHAFPLHLNSKLLLTRITQVEEEAGLATEGFIGGTEVSVSLHRDHQVKKARIDMGGSDSVHCSLGGWQMDSSMMQSLSLLSWLLPNSKTSLGSPKKCCTYSNTNLVAHLSLTMAGNQSFQDHMLISMLRAKKSSAEGASIQKVNGLGSGQPTLMQPISHSLEKN